MSAFDDPHADGFYVSFDKKLIDPAFVIREIQHSYWGAWRSPIVILRSLDHSLCAGLYKHAVWNPATEPEKPKDEQVGFARVVTDYCTFAWICDVLVTKQHRGAGLGQFLMRAVMEHPDVKPRACMLATRDAHGLYRKFGFEPFEAMKRLPGQHSE